MSNIFIGCIFIFFHIKVSGFDLLADFIGYALIYMGECKLSSDSVNFKKAKPWTLGMAIASYINCIGGVVGFYYSNLFFVVLNLITILVSLYILYLIDTGIREIEWNTNKNLNSEKLLLIWKVQAVLSVGYAMLSLIPNHMIAIIAAVFNIAEIIAFVIFLVYLYKAKKVLENNGNEEQNDLSK